MPIPALIAGGAAIAGAGLTAASQGKMNKRSIRFQREMFDKTNEYNKPINQRKRLEEAGLNPNLMYGNSASPGMANQPGAPDLKAVDFTTAGAQVGNALNDYYARANAASQISVNKAREEQIKTDTINKGLESVYKGIQNAGGAIDLRKKMQLYDNAIQIEEQKLTNLGLQGAYSKDRNTRENLMVGETVKKLNQEINNLKKQGEILNEEAIIKKIDRKLYEDYKIRPQDPLYYRILGDIFSKLNSNDFWNKIH